MSRYMTTDFERGMDVGRQAEAAQLKAENAKLRESRAEIYQCAKAYSFENAKLRELAVALLTSHEKMCIQRGHCFGCTFFYEEVKPCPYVKISQTLRELGIEVDS